MIHYDKNSTIVIHTIKRYGYSQRSIEWSNNCFMQLERWFQKHDIQIFNGDKALDWVEGEDVCIRYKKNFHSAIIRLIDVYESGAVMRSHLVFYSKILPSDFVKVRNEYLSSIDGEFSKRHLRNISDACNRFLGFLHMNDLNKFSNISYSTMILYYKDLTQVNHTPIISADIIEGFMLYLAQQGLCSYGYGWYLFYYRSSKDPYSVNFTLENIRELPENSTQCTTNQVMQNIPSFLKILCGYRYSKPMIRTSEAALRLLFVIHDMSNIHYSTALAETWIASEGHRLFKSSFIMARRGLELFDEYIKTGTIDPYKRRKRRPSEVELLPKWCQTAVVQLMEQRTKEGRNKKTISDHEHVCTTFCQFLSGKGIEDFNAMTPTIIKEFNLQNQHRTSKGKSTFQGMLRKFLVFLHREGFHSQPNLHLALPNSSAYREHIVDVLTKNEKIQIQIHKERSKYPIELRDAAILEIGLKMGIRGIDIANLRLSDINWKSHTIRLTQRKTNIEIWLPMSTNVGNAIYRYLKEGRPCVTESSYVFLKTRAPFGPISAAVCRHAIERVLPERNTPGSKFHVTRRTFATELLKNQVGISVITDALGHSDTGTVHKYLSLDEERMRLCPLSLTESGLMLNRRNEYEM